MRYLTYKWLHFWGGTKGVSQCHRWNMLPSRNRTTWSRPWGRAGGP